MRNWRYITNKIDPNPRRLKGTDSRFAACSRPIHIDVDLPHATFHRLTGCCFTGPLRRKRCALARPFKPLVPCTRPDHGVAAHVRDRHNRIIEGRFHMCDPVLDDPALFPLPFLNAHTNSLLTRCEISGCRCWLQYRPWLATNPRSLPFSCASVRFRPLPTDRKSLAVSQATVSPSVDQPFDVHRKGFSKIALDLVILLDDFTELHDLVLAEVLHPNRAIHAGLRQNLQRRCAPNSKNIS